MLKPTTDCIVTGILGAGKVLIVILCIGIALGRAVYAWRFGVLGFRQGKPFPGANRLPLLLCSPLREWKLKQWA